MCAAAGVQTDPLPVLRYVVPEAEGAGASARQGAAAEPAAVTAEAEPLGPEEERRELGGGTSAADAGTGDQLDPEAVPAAVKAEATPLGPEGEEDADLEVQQTRILDRIAEVLIQEVSRRCFAAWTEAVKALPEPTKGQRRKERAKAARRRAT